LGASHNAPQVFQVAVSHSYRNRTVGRTILQFYQRNRIGQITVTNTESKSGPVPVSSRETTLLDICNDLDIVGGINNAANLVIELCDAEKPSVESIAALSVLYPAPAPRRLGWLMETFTDVSGLDSLREVASGRELHTSTLDPLSGTKDSFIDSSWSLKINRKVEPDL
jgi:predicted transcriptional regulator of viral defense system